MPAASPFPAFALSATREERTEHPLEILEGRLPPDLHGHYFWMGPVGTVDSGGLPYPGMPSVINGDGMVHRLDFDGSGPRITTRILKPPCYHADAAARPGTEWEPLRFHCAGILRGSPLLGTRNYGNTALTPMRMPGSDRARLLCCYDPGRPLEIDPVSLRTVTPVGYQDEWRPEALHRLPFAPILSTAHPAFDGHTGDLFTVNFGRSGLSMMDLAPGRLWRDVVPRALDGLMWRAAGLFEERRRLGRRARTAMSRARTALSRALGVTIPDDFLYVVRWSGDGDLERWRVVLPDGTPAWVSQSMHQVAVTRNHVILLDTNFKLDLDQFFNNPLRDSEAADRLLRALVADPQGSETILYIVDRRDLADGQRPLRGDTRERQVRARRVRFPLGAVHFLADYFDDDGRLTLHVGHGCALDIAEWVRPYDRSAWDDAPLPEHVHGFIAGAMDVSRVGRYVIEAASGRVVEARLAASDEHTWALALYAGRDVPAWDKPPERIRSLYWFASGFWPDLSSRFIHDLYADYPDRLASLEGLRRIAQEGGRPPTLFRVDTESMDLADVYAFEGSTHPSSPQFVPRPGSTGDTDGWIACTVWTDRDNQVWVFDAADLASGPLCRLGHPDLDFGFSMHSAWLPSIRPRTADYRVDARRDYGPRLEGRPLAADLFEREVFPYLE
ncbi:MAG: carotenoid oxygenase family protein [Myxococcota bacterium]